VSDLSAIASSRLVKLARLYRREIDRALRAYGLSDATAMAILQIARAMTHDGHAP